MELFHHPENAFVAGFIGAPSMNFLDVEVREVRDGRATVASGSVAPINVPIDVPSQRERLTVGARARLAIRPQYLSQATGDQALISGRVEVIERLGTETVVNLKVNEAERVLMSISRDLAFDVGQQVGMRFDPERSHLFAA